MRRNAKPVSQTFWLQPDVPVGKAGTLYRDLDTPNAQHIVNGGGLWPRNTVIEAKAAELGVKPGQIIGVEMSLEFFVLQEDGQALEAEASTTAA